MHNNKRNWKKNNKIPQNKKLIWVRQDIHKILKISCPFISSPLNYVCNKILFWAVFPDRLKHTVIKPLHKNGDWCDVSAYRCEVSAYRCEVSTYQPVSLLTSFSKIFERVMQTRVLKHLTKYIKH
jgi:hypothetical protein